MLVHSGSRNLGETIYHDFMKTCSDKTHKGAKEGTNDFVEYLRRHDIALNFARRNRMVIAHRILEQIDSRRGRNEAEEQ